MYCVIDNGGQIMPYATRYALKSYSANVLLSAYIFSCAEEPDSDGQY